MWKNSKNMPAEGPVLKWLTSRTGDEGLLTSDQNKRSVSDESGDIDKRMQYLASIFDGSLGKRTRDLPNSAEEYRQLAEDADAANGAQVKRAFGSLFSNGHFNRYLPSAYSSDVPQYRIHVADAKRGISGYLGLGKYGKRGFPMLGLGKYGKRGFGYLGLGKYGKRTSDQETTEDQIGGMVDLETIDPTEELSRYDKDLILQKIDEYTKRGYGNLGLGKYGKRGYGNLGLGKYGKRGFGYVGLGKYGKRGYGNLGLGKYGKRGFGYVGLGKYGKRGYGLLGLGKYGKRNAADSVYDQKERRGFGLLGLGKYGKRQTRSADKSDQSGEISGLKAQPQRHMLDLQRAFGNILGIRVGKPDTQRHLATENDEKNKPTEH